MLLHTHTHTHTQPLVRVHACTHTHTHNHSCVCTRAHTHTHTHTRTCTHAHACTHTHTHIHTCAHTYARTHTHTGGPSVCDSGGGGETASFNQELWSQRDSTCIIAAQIRSCWEHIAGTLREQPVGNQISPRFKSLDQWPVSWRPTTVK